MLLRGTGCGVSSVTRTGWNAAKGDRAVEVGCQGGHSRAQVDIDEVNHDAVPASWDYVDRRSCATGGCASAGMLVVTSAKVTPSAHITAYAERAVIAKPGEP